MQGKGTVYSLTGEVSAKSYRLLDVMKERILGMSTPTEGADRLEQDTLLDEILNNLHAISKNLDSAEEFFQTQVANKIK